MITIYYMKIITFMGKTLEKSLDLQYNSAHSVI